MSVTILVTGFGRFPGAPINPTAALVKRIAARRRADVRCIAHVFPTRYDAVARELPELIAKHRPDAIVMFGLAARRKHLSIETRAQNRISRFFPDAARVVPASAVIAPGELAMRGRAPFVRLLAAARSTGAKSALSRNAGFYVCNYVYWHALAHGPRLAVFVHVPKVQVPMPKRRIKRRRMTEHELARAADAIVAAVAAASRR